MGIVHRDLKPDNIMVGRSRDGADVVKVVDFGIAKAADSEGQNVTKTGLIVGTPEYMSPEQIAGDKLDGRSDLYSLALVAFNMLTGSLPFPAASAQESLIMRLTEAPRSLAEVRPELSWPPALQAVMDRALTRDMAKRYARTTDFARELVRAVEAMPEAQVAEGGTLVMSATPATAVASAPAGAVPATRVASLGSSHPEPLGSHPERSEGPGPGAPDVVALRKPVPKNRMPLYAGLAAVLVAGVWGGSVLFNGSAANAADTPTEPYAANMQSAAPTAMPAATPVSTGPLDSSQVAEVTSKIFIDDTAGTRRILGELEAMRPRAQGYALDRLDIGRVQAHVILHENGQACELGARVRTRKLAPKLRELLDNYVQLAECQ
jgi:hypothetical protein